MSEEPILVVVLGGRNWPAYWSLLAWPSADVVTVCTETDVSSGPAVQAWLRARGQRVRAAWVVHSHDREKSRAQFAALFADARGHPVLVNATNGPKAIAVGACEAAWGVPASGDVRVFTVETAAHRLWSLAGPLPHVAPPQVKLDDYLAAYGREPKDSGSLPAVPGGKEALRPLAALMIRAEWAAFVQHLRLQGRKMGDLVTAPPQFAGLTSDLWSAGLVEGLCAAPGGGVTFRYASAHSFGFLDGLWLEMLAADAASGLRDERGQSLFTDVRFSQEAPAPREQTRKELDVVCLDSYGLLMYASCKTGRKAVTEDLNHYLDEIAARAREVGDQYTARLLITNRPRTEVTENADRRAAGAKVTLVCREELGQLPEILGRCYRAARAAVL